MNSNSFYTLDELKGIGLKKFGNEVSISRKAIFNFKEKG